MTTPSTDPKYHETLPTTEEGNNNEETDTATAETASDYDTQFFQRVVADAGRWAYGVVLVEVWVMDESQTHLFRPEGGFWVDPVSVDYGQNGNHKFRRLIDPTLDDYFPPTPQAPGVGIPGILWAQAHRGNLAAENNSVRSGTIFGGGTIFAPFNQATETFDASGSKQARNIKRKKSFSIDVGAMAAALGGDSSSHGKRRHRRRFSQGLSRSSPQHREDVEMGRWTSSWRARRNAHDATPRGPNLLHRHSLLPHEVRWRRISELSNDPDQPFDPRIHYLENECELGFVAGVPFQIGAIEGIVVYMARKTVDVQKLVASTNEEYLTYSSLLIGSAFALRKPRLAAEKERHLESDEMMRRLKTKMKALKAMNKSVRSLVREESMQKKTNVVPSDDSNLDEEESLGDVCCIVFQKGVKFLERKAQSCFKKFFGSKTPPPPPFTWEQTFITFMGTCISLFILISIDTTVVETYGQEFGLVLGPVGALECLLFSLTQAPASQPLNCLCGQCISLFISYGFGKSSIDRRVKICLSTSLSIAAMARLGITHPPAAASAMILSSSTHSLSQIGVMLLGNVLAILLASFFNNLSDKRQYPTAWFPFCDGFMGSICRKVEIEKSTKPSKQTNLDSTKTEGKVHEGNASPRQLPESNSRNSVPSATQVSTTSAVDDKKKERTALNGEERPSILRAVSSFITGEVSKAKDADHFSVHSEIISRSRSINSKEGAIDLTTVFQQAHNADFIVDRGRFDANHSVSRISSASQNRSGSQRYLQHVMCDHSQSDNSGTIPLSEVLATAAGQSIDRDPENSNQKFMRLSQDGRSDTQSPPSTNARLQGIAVVHDCSVAALSENLSVLGPAGSIDEVKHNCDSHNDSSVVEA